MIKEYMSTQINVGDDFGWQREHPLRQSLQRYRHDKFSQTQWNKIYNQWHKPFHILFMGNGATADAEDFLGMTKEGKDFVIKVHRWCEKHRAFVFNI